jgi:hypothetical protein
MQRYKSTGLSLPYKLLKDIDSERGDIPRSRFLLRLIVKAYEERQSGATKESGDKFEESFSDLLSGSLDDLSERNRGDSSSLSSKVNKSSHKIAKSKQGSLNIRFPGLSSSESRTPQQ